MIHLYWIRVQCYTGLKQKTGFVGQRGVSSGKGSVQYALLNFCACRARKILRFLLSKHLKSAGVVPASLLASGVLLDVVWEKSAADRILWHLSIHSFCHFPMFLRVALPCEYSMYILQIRSFLVFRIVSQKKVLGSPYKKAVQWH